ncbi:MAG: MFS transporter [Candidatus Atribacteria bacterium]|nr:MFS transporter [Candidatus Atribacteria bacterium]MDD3539301.1 MFS transporter [Atribacterota bacterium]
MNISNNKDREEKYFNWQVLLVISLSSIAMGIYRDGVSSLFPFLQAEFELSRVQVAFYSTCLYLTSSIFSIFGGRLVDLKGTKWGMISGIILVGFFLILHSMASNFTFLLILAAFSGVGMSINPSAANKGITEWFSPKWRSTATGIWSTSFPIGGALAASLLPVLGILTGWRKSILIPGFFILFCGLLIFLLYKDREKAQNNLKEKSEQEISFWRGFRDLIKNRNLLTISVFGFFLGSTEGAILTHFTLFLYLDYSLVETIAGAGFAFVQFGSIFGRLFWGAFCDKFLNADRKKTFLILSFIFLLTTLFFGLFLKRIIFSLPILFSLAFLTGFSGRGWDGIFFPSVSEMVREEQVGAAIGMSLLFTRTGILVSPLIFGFIADFRGAYDLSWILLGLMLFFSSIIFYLRSFNKDGNFNNSYTSR